MELPSSLLKSFGNDNTRMLQEIYNITVSTQSVYINDGSYQSLLLSSFSIPQN